MKNLLLVIFAGSILSIGITGCFGDGKDETAAPEGDTDTDTDADSDTDADADADSDTDTDVADCVENTGWPCTCTAEVCDDGSSCIALQGMGDGSAGYCAATCTEGDHSSCPDTDFLADSMCGVQGEGVFYCVLMCTVASDCPADQDCADTGHGYGLCHP